MSAAPIQAIVAALAQSPAAQAAPSPAVPDGPSAFAHMLASGVDQVNQKVANAQKLATAFALDDSVPLHEVTFALQEARISLEFMLQARAKLVDAYQQLANMPL
jgi:flagellar hook-basal body complex protein FliE